MSKPKTRAPSHGARRNATLDLQGQVQAISRSMAVIEFDLDGTVLEANPNFLAVMGYAKDEIIGKHHRMFVEPKYAQSPEYGYFWARLRSGEAQSAEFPRFGKSGKVVWLQASYNPILDASGHPYKVVKFATDITAQKLANLNYEGQMRAISRSMATIEFDLDGTILDANDNFLACVGYEKREIIGKHHRTFVDPEYAKSNEYAQFWASLRNGEAQTAEFARVGKGGKVVWLQASYNPILDSFGQPCKVVKFATDITAQKLANLNSSQQMQAISRSMATIEFAMDGTILDANENFLSVMGYTKEEIRGRHHRTFLQPAYAESADYREFWTRLRQGEAQTAEFLRIGKGGNEILAPGFVQSHPRREG